MAAGRARPRASLGDAAGARGRFLKSGAARLLWPGRDAWAVGTLCTGCSRRDRSAEEVVGIVNDVTTRPANRRADLLSVHSQVPTDFLTVRANRRRRPPARRLASTAARSSIRTCALQHSNDGGVLAGANVAHPAYLRFSPLCRARAGAASIGVYALLRTRCELTRDDRIRSALAPRREVSSCSAPAACCHLGVAIVSGSCRAPARSSACVRVGRPRPHSLLRRRPVAVAWNRAGSARGREIDGAVRALRSE